MTARFKDKIAIVTGAGNGIGFGIAQAFAAEGAKVVIAEINAEAAARAAKLIGSQATAVTTDISDEAQIERLVQAVIAQHGRIDILVNNAGIVVHKPIVELDRHAWDRQIAVQLTGPFLLMKHVGRHMIERGGGGKIVSISSVAAQNGRVKVAPHCAAKGGLTMLTKVAAMEFAEHKINVNAVAPGLVDVASQRDEHNISAAYKSSYIKMTPLGRIGETSDIAKAVLFLASPDADWITGQLIFADGGVTAGTYSLQGLQDHTILEGHSKT
jgi:NAD(P)-dependent dehydrogenase (short-subunit alcohol dehydrogenase family)